MSTHHVRWERVLGAFLLIGALGCGSDPAQPDDAAKDGNSAQPPAASTPSSPAGTPTTSAPGSSATPATPATTPPASTPMTMTMPPPASGNGMPSTTPTPTTTDPAKPTGGQEPPPAVDVMGGRIYWLDIAGNGVYTAKPDGSEKKKIATALAAPDGISVDECSGTIYFSNMGSALGNSGQASVQRANWDGSELKTLVQPGSGVNTAKQLTLDLTNGHVYFADREGAKVWRMKLDGSELMPVVSGHDFAQLVGVAVDAAAGHLYFTDRNRGLLLRTGLEMPAGKTAADRDDIETLVKSASGAMPIDLALNLEARQLYWTDRQLGTVKRIGLDLPAGDDPANRSDEETVIDGLTQPIGISLDVAGGKLYVTEAGGAVHRAALDGSGDQVIAQTSSGTGIAFALIGPNGEHMTCQ